MALPRCVPEPALILGTRQHVLCTSSRLTQNVAEHGLLECVWDRRSWCGEAGDEGERSGLDGRDGGSAEEGRYHCQRMWRRYLVDGGGRGEAGEKYDAGEVGGGIIA